MTEFLSQPARTLIQDGACAAYIKGTACAIAFAHGFVSLSLSLSLSLVRSLRTVLLSARAAARRSTRPRLPSSRPLVSSRASLLSLRRVSSRLALCSSPPLPTAMFAAARLLFSPLSSPLFSGLCLSSRRLLSSRRCLGFRAPFFLLPSSRYPTPFTNIGIMRVQKLPRLKFINFVISDLIIPEILSLINLDRGTPMLASILE